MSFLKYKIYLILYSKQSPFLKHEIKKHIKIKSSHFRVLAVGKISPLTNKPKTYWIQIVIL